MKGDTATNTLKPAKVETGATVNVPLFISVGERIKLIPAPAIILSALKA
jgi:elongation factor P